MNMRNSVAALHTPSLGSVPRPWQAGSPLLGPAELFRAIGRVNFLGDPSQTPHLKPTAIDETFGVSQATGQAKSKAILNLLKIHQLDPEWTLPSRLDDNPLVWMLSVNGFLMDIRDAPREAQEVAFEQGLIPYIPADRSSDDDGKP